MPVECRVWQQKNARLRDKNLSNSSKDDVTIEIIRRNNQAAIREHDKVLTMVLSRTAETGPHRHSHSLCFDLARYWNIQTRWYKVHYTATAFIIFSLIECLDQKQKRTCNTWPRGYKTFFMLNSTKHGFLNVHKYKDIKKFGFFRLR